MRDTDGNQPWARTGFLLAGGFVVALVVMLIAVLATTGQEDNTSRPASPAAAPAEQARPAAQDSTEIPTAPPAGVRWELHRSIALPFHETAGPRSITGSVASGYAHTPTGALMAAAHIPVRKLVGPDWQAVLDQQVEPGPGREAYAQARAQVSNALPPPGELGQIAAFKFVNYSPDLATIQFVSRFAATGSMQVVTTTVVWRDGDWRLVLQPDGGESPSAQAVHSLTGFVPWGGV